MHVKAPKHYKMNIMNLFNGYNIVHRSMKIKFERIHYQTVIPIIWQRNQKLMVDLTSTINYEI